MNTFDETSLFSVDSVDPLTLPFVWFTERSGFPCEMAVYFVISGTDEVLYIGRTKDLFARWQNHHRLKQFAQMEDVRIAWIAINDAILLPLVEKALIAHFSPPLNGSRVPVEPRIPSVKLILGDSKKSPTRIKWNLRQLMADRRVSNKDLAEAMDVHSSAVSRMKLLDSMPRLDGRDLMAICTKLNCRLTELLEEE
jgi:DNA-binding Xre family transcriptional regulator